MNLLNSTVINALREEIVKNSTNDYVSSAIVFLVGLVILKIFKTVIISKLKQLALKTKNDVDDALIEFVDEIHWPVFVIGAAWFASKPLHLPVLVDTAFNYVIYATLVYLAIKLSFKVINYFTEKEVRRRKEQHEGQNVSVVNFLSIGAKTIVIILIGILVLSNIGLNVSSLLAGLGIGGIALAFGLQRVLEDIFSSVSIYFDQPFKEGDFIVVGTDRGTVRRIGLRSTRIKTLRGEELIVPNKELTSTRVSNLKNMEQRRIEFNVGVEYNTPVRKIKKIKAAVKKIITQQPSAEFDRVHFKAFGDFSLIFEIVYFVKSRSVKEYKDTQEAINLGMMKYFEKEDIKFAYPTQTIILQKENNV
ncbi:mechanosensitive ion channel family protein [Candidatus Woesearchaeota archaeon]|nr:mechanosensitive ion channel family protein [Candidatus Woesearchaeota archaeon]